MRQALANFQSLTASLFGVTAGILGLQSYAGFLFYFAFTTICAILFHFFRIAPASRAAGLSPLDTSIYFKGPFDFWTGGFMAGLPGYILTWTLFFGLVRA
ncbi:unnamed protein product [Parascedosporium putredinis]|uniref:ER membrane protein complex subunit 6 n=1 Tax=Parascedosporium putredinis TaxID=1442378 RepID=A0A9P1MAV0_9PEZI|nr:unnamed protein product [Parascedosporium putredinis]CAI7998330.1 unnamed protein product [Parascedosporium putredinis]